jgi:hypothetical protein
LVLVLLLAKPFDTLRRQSVTLLSLSSSVCTLAEIRMCEFNSISLPFFVVAFLSQSSACSEHAVHFVPEHSLFFVFPLNRCHQAGST